MNDGELATQMRTALRCFAKSVVIIACVHQDRRFAMAATAVSEISMDPPSLLICVNQSASIHSPLSAGVQFSVNVLHSSHRELATLCSSKGKGEERFVSGAWTQRYDGTPYLVDAQACFFCRQDGRLPYGTHEIFLGRVVEVTNHGMVDPLVYVNGRYALAREAL